MEKLINLNNLKRFKQNLTDSIKPPYKEVTYSELKELRDNNQLSPGSWYRMTDFVTTARSTNFYGDEVEFRSAEHPFDLIILATSTNTISEDVKAVLHEGDDYFDKPSVHMHKWELKYSLDNDDNYFYWADKEDGKGVIYYMKDERNNECSYDFKNIQFKRYKVYGCGHGQVADCVGYYSNYVDGLSLDYDDYKWFYTFSFMQYQYTVDYDNEDVSYDTDGPYDIEDYSLGEHFGKVLQTNGDPNPDYTVDNSEGYLCNNKITLFTEYEEDNVDNSYYLLQGIALSDVVFIVNGEYCDYYFYEEYGEKKLSLYIYGEGIIKNNIISGIDDNDGSHLTFLDTVKDCNIKNCYNFFFMNDTFKTTINNSNDGIFLYVNKNTIENSNNVYFGYNCTRNHIRNSSFINFYNSCSQNIIEGSDNIVFNSSCCNNLIRQGCSSVSLGNECSQTTLEQQCSNILISANAGGNTIMQDSSHISINSYCVCGVIGKGCNRVTIQASNASLTHYVGGFVIENGFNRARSTDFIVTLPYESDDWKYGSVWHVYGRRNQGCAFMERNIDKENKLIYYTTNSGSTWTSEYSQNATTAEINALTF